MGLYINLKPYRKPRAERIAINHQSPATTEFVKALRDAKGSIEVVSPELRAQCMAYID